MPSDTRIRDDTEFSELGVDALVAPGIIARVAKAAAIQLPEDVFETFATVANCGNNTPVWETVKKGIIAKVNAAASRRLADSLPDPEQGRPDYCLQPHLSSMLRYGCTRLEIGVQSLYEDVARDTNRGA
ncbi:hypothetical protein VTI28DRAFT_2880 [Corynascus sepedonium]